MDWSPLVISIKTSLVGTGLACVSGVMAARLVARLGGRSRAVLDGAFTLPMVLPPTVVGFILLSVFGRAGPVGAALEAIGVRLVFSWGATVMAASTVAFPLVYRTTLASFDHLDPTVIASARTLGLSERRIFLSLMLPLSSPGIVAGTVLAFARALGEFGATLMVAGNIPGKTQTIPIAIYFASESGSMARASLWVAVLSGISFLAVLAINTSGRSGR